MENAIDLVFPEADVHLFDAETGESVMKREIPTVETESPVD